MDFRGHNSTCSGTDAIFWAELCASVLRVQPVAGVCQDQSERLSRAELEEGLSSGDFCVPRKWGDGLPLPSAAPRAPQQHATVLTFTQMCTQPAGERATPAEGGHRWLPFCVRESPALPWSGTPDSPCTPAGQIWPNPC